MLQLFGRRGSSERQTRFQQQVALHSPHRCRLDLGSRKQTGCNLTYPSDPLGYAGPCERLGTMNNIRSRRCRISTPVMTIDSGAVRGTFKTVLLVDST